MLSNGLAAAAAALPTTAPTTTPAVPPLDATDGPAWMVIALVVWAVVGLAAAAGLGAFRRRGIVGPERLGTVDSAWSLLGICGGGMVALIVGSMLASGTVAAALRVTHAHPSTDVNNLVVSGLAEAIAVGVVLALVSEWWSTDRWVGLRRIGLGPRGIPNALAGGTAALFIVFPLVQLTGLGVVQVYRWMNLKQAKPHPVLEMLRADHRPALAVAAVLTASVVAPVAEELLFRGLLQTMLGRLFNWAADQWTVQVPRHVSLVLPHTRPAARWAAVVVTSVAFAAIHGEPAFLAPIFVLSLGLGFVYERSGNLWMNIVTHSLFNTAQIIVFVAAGG